jgi:hypothetical protein
MKSKEFLIVSHQHALQCLHVLLIKCVLLCVSALDSGLNNNQLGYGNGHVHGWGLGF